MNIVSVINFIRKDNFRKLYIGIICVGVTALSFAYFAEYVLHFTPCPLCIYERFPFLLMIKISVVALLIKKVSKYSLFLIVANLLGGCLLSFYHSGIERGVFSPSSLCSTLVHIPKHLSISDIKNLFYSNDIATCAKATIKLLGLSMAEWNFLLNFSLLFVLLFIWFYPNNNNNLSNISQNLRAYKNL
jgi:disulfide bond formation protein DsbB